MKPTKSKPKGRCLGIGMAVLLLATAMATPAVAEGPPLRSEVKPPTIEVPRYADAPSIVPAVDVAKVLAVNSFDSALVVEAARPFADSAGGLSVAALRETAETVDPGNERWSRETDNSTLTMRHSGRLEAPSTGALTNRGTVLVT